MTPTTGPWLTAAALAGLPGLPASERRMRDWLARTGVPQRQAAGKRGGGGVEWDCSALPEATRAALMLRQGQAAAPADARVAITTQLAPDRKPTLPTQPRPAMPPAHRVPSRLDATCADARLHLLDQAYALQQAGHSLDAAFTLLAHQLADPQAPAALLARAQAANQRARQGGALVSAKTLWKWHGKHQAAGWAALVPAPILAKPLTSLADDVAAVLARYHSTSGAARNLSRCAQAVNTELGRPFDDWVALCHRARRALPKVNLVGLIKARHKGAERDAKLPYKRRLTDNIHPHEVWVCDGHTFKAKVRHPVHGQPFAPEVTVMMDVRTHKVVGWSVSLSETTRAVGDCTRRAVLHVGYPASIIYSDNGPGQTGKQIDCDVVGLYGRLGVTHELGLPSKPQGHGVIERAWQTHLIPLAGTYGSYQGGNADSDTVRKLRLELAREATAIKRSADTGAVVQLSRKVPTWAEWMADVEAILGPTGKYNSTHRHRGNPKHTSGPHQGKHMTPNEAEQALAQPVPDVLRVDEATLRHMFMPAEQRVPQRGWVKLPWGHYYSDALMQHGIEGTPVRVHYDLHDARRVWVWTLAGRFVCDCLYEGNSIDYFPPAAIDFANEKRVRTALKRLEGKGDLARAELQPVVQDLQALPAPGHGLSFNMPAAEPVPVLASAAGNSARPTFFESAASRYEWLMQNPAAWGEGDATWLTDYAASTDYSALADYFSSRGIAWPDEGDSPGFNQAG